MTDDLATGNGRYEGPTDDQPGGETDDVREMARVLRHDLRNPLHVATANVSLAARECDSDRLDAAAAALERLDGLLGALPRLASISRPVSDPDPVSLDGVAMASWEAIETRRARVVVFGDQTVLADRARLRQVLENLFRNAVTHAGESATVTVGALEAAVGFYVEDDGPGIPPEARDRVLEQGYSTAKEGGGLGLYIVDQVARAHGWDLRVTRGTGGGARFEFSNVDLADDRQ